MRRYLKLKSIAMLFAILAGLTPPLVVAETAQAQQRVSQAQRDAARGRVQAGRAQHVNRSAHRPRHNVHHRPRHTVHHRPRHTVHHRPRNVVVVHPRRTWHPGGAIAAGAAIGFVAGAAATSWAGPPPRAGYCWFYTNSARTRGFWDVCPRW
ncbi:conserved exported hypothetical protein [Hyphomicrobiales bacterium]|nr:conserved exported hypothetical protein [Hyphomicrobiales bacterium]CAH1701886.1 conserved exported hypothetical protein [Hyphomicrobiales bacterium]CAI0346043.1 conserved exported hypothetical protein [Hyphomicrobiales bacterium]